METKGREKNLFGNYLKKDFVFVFVLISSENVYIL